MLKRIPAAVLLFCALVPIASRGAELQPRYYRTPKEYVAAYEAYLDMKPRPMTNWFTYSPGAEMLGSRRLEGLVLLLESRHPRARQWACGRLGRLKDREAVEPLIRHLLTERDPSTRKSAARALGEIGDRRALMPLLAVLTAPDVPPDPNKRPVIYVQVDRHGNRVPPPPPPPEPAQVPGVPAEMPAVPKPEAVGADLKPRPLKYSWTRGDVALALGRLGDKRALPYLVHALTSSDYYTRRYAAQALAAMSAPAKNAAGPLLFMLKSRDNLERRDAIRALGRLEIKRAGPTLIAVLKKREKRVERAAAARALGEIGEKAAVGALTEALKKSKYTETRAAAAGALGLIGEAVAVEALRTAAEKDRVQEVRVRAAKALWDLKAGDEALWKAIGSRGIHHSTRFLGEVCAEMGDAGVKFLIKGLADEKSRTVRQNCGYAMQWQTGAALDACVAAAARQLSHKNKWLRWEAGSALRQMARRNRAAVEPALDALLATALKDDDSSARSWARAALAELGPLAAPRAIEAAGKPETIFTALGLMARIRDHRLVPVLVKFAKDRDPGIRAAAVAALRWQHHEQKLTVAVAALRDSSPKVREEAIRVLEHHYWARRYFKEVVRCLNDSSKQVRRTAARALKYSLKPEAVPHLKARASIEKDDYTRKEMTSVAEHITKRENYRLLNEARRKAREKREALERK